MPLTRFAAVRAAMVAGDGIREVSRTVGLGMGPYSRSRGTADRVKPSGERGDVEAYRRWLC
jgi:hypothetical protein